jgi:hypothetical protein
MIPRRPSLLSCGFGIQGYVVQLLSFLIGLPLEIYPKDRANEVTLLSVSSRARLVPHLGGNKGGNEDEW